MSELMGEVCTQHLALDCALCDPHRPVEPSCPLEASSNPDGFMTYVPPTVEHWACEAEIRVQRERAERAEKELLEHGGVGPITMRVRAQHLKMHEETILECLALAAALRRIASEARHRSPAWVEEQAAKALEGGT